MFGLRYLAAYSTGAAVGVFNELVQKPNQPCFSGNPDYSCTLTLGGANVYGWSVLAMTVYFDAAKVLKIPTPVTLLLIGPMLAVLECAMGKISKAYFKGPQRWKYPDSYCPACDGYISLMSSLYFSVMGLAYWFVVYRPFISKI